MTDQQQGTPPTLNWRFALVVGLSIGLAIPTSQEVHRAVEPSIGKLGAVLVSIVTAGVAAGLVALVTVWVLRLFGKDRT
jgi:hypothetical protein